MTEKQAWLNLAEAWSKPDLVGDLARVKDIRGWYRHGLCSCIHGLWFCGQITDEIRLRMYEKIETMHGGRVGHAYKWPLTVEGAAQRSIFCRLRAEELPDDQSEATPTSESPVDSDQGQHV